MPNAPTLRSDLSRVDPLDVAAGCSALVMLAENWPHAQRLHALSSHALCQPPNGRRHRIEYPRWNRWLRDSPSLDDGPPWDPPEGLLCEPVLFFGGSFVLATGGDPEAVFSLQLILDTLVFADWPEEAEDFRRHAFALARATLTLGHGVTHAVGLRRYAPIGHGAERVVIPGAARLAALASCFSLLTAELEELLRGPADVLGRLTHDLGEEPLPESPSGFDPFDRTPIVRFGDRHVIAAPLSLAAALRHSLLALAFEHGWERALSELAAERSFLRVSDAAQRMGWNYLGTRSPTDENPLFSGLFSFDSDKAAHITMVWDDLSDYDPGNASGDWRPRVGPEALGRIMTEVEESLTFGEGNRVNDFVHIVILSGFGRGFVFGLPDIPTPCGSPILLLSTESFERITLLAPDQLELWKFARASAVLRDTAMVVGFNALDEYAFWRDNGCSFYFGDDRPPNMVVIDGSHGRELRERVAFRTDVHAVTTPHGTTEPVVLINSSGGIPVYAPLFDLRGHPRLVTIGDGFLTWTVGREDLRQPRSPRR